MSASFLPPGFARWMRQSVIAVSGWLYIQGGEIYVGEPINNETAFVNEQTFSIDLTQSWSTASVAVISSNLSEGQIAARNPELWYDEKFGVVHSLGGLLYEHDPTINVYGVDFKSPVQLWSFSTSTDGSVAWQSTPQLNTGLSVNVAAASVANSPNAHYSLGGMFVNSAGVIGNGDAIDNFLTYNFTTQTFTNVSIPLPATPHISYGQAQYVPNYGEDGIIIYLGGKTSPDSSSVDLSTTQGFDSILIYDISSNKFFRQPAAQPPTKRWSFCSVGAGGSDNSSYEIFIYGGSQGFDPSDEKLLAFSKLYVLSLPAFVWLEVPNSNGTWRFYHECILIGGRQMLSVGGAQDLSQTIYQKQPDPWANGLGIFDLTAQNWTMKYDHTAAAYEPSSLITDYYASEARFPTWSDPALKAIFEKSPSASSTSTTPSPETTTGNNTARTTDKKISIGVIAGAVTGGILFLALIGLATWWTLKRRRARRLVIPISQNAYNKPELDVIEHRSVEKSPYELHEACTVGELHSNAIYELPGAETYEWPRQI